MKNSRVTNVEKEILPDGWTTTALGQTIQLSREKIKPENIRNEKYVGLEHIESNTGIVEHGESSNVRSTKSVFKKGDILYGRLRPYLNKVCIPSFDGICSTDILVLMTYDFLTPKFLCLYLRTPNFVQFATGQSQGVNLPRVKFSTIKDYPLPLPPVNEQNRIVSKIESIFAQIDTLEESLKAVKSRMKRYKQAVLKLAFEGKLVPQYPNDEPAKTLLKRPRQDVEMKMDTVQHEMPKGWTKTTLEKVVDVLDSKRRPVNSKERSKRQGDIPYYGATGQVGYIDDYIFNEELVLLGEDGVPFLELLKRKAYLINGKSWVNNHAHVLRGVKVSNEFLCFFLNQIDYTSFVSGTTRLKLNQSSMKAIPIMFPDLLEQNRIVSKIKSVFAHVDMIDVHVARLLETLATLRQSVLKYAFEGKLVPQNPHDEPANELLEKIQGINNG